METTSRSKQTFCARCGLAKSGHGFLGGACSNFIQPGSKEAHEARRAKLSVVETPAPDTTLPIDGNVLDRVLLAGALEHQNEAIERAKQHLKNGLMLSRAGVHDLARGEYKAALAALGDLGAS